MYLNFEKKIYSVGWLYIFIVFFTDPLAIILNNSNFTYFSKLYLLGYLTEHYMKFYFIYQPSSFLPISVVNFTNY